MLKMQNLERVGYVRRQHYPKVEIAVFWRLEAGDLVISNDSYICTT
jgi:hypothetical protein